MQIEADTSEPLEEQSELLLRIYQAELAKDPSRRATECSSNIGKFDTLTPPGCRFSPTLIDPRRMNP
jgi:hypothetical protein